MTPAPRDATALEGLPPTRYPSFNEADVSDKPAWIRKRPLLTADTVARQDARRLDAFRSLMAVDDAVRAIMTALQRKGIVEKTVVVYLSDNGHVFGEHRWTEKTCVYDECTRTPLFIRYPKARQGTVQRLVSNVDLAPTLLELAGVAPTSRMDGLSLVPLLTGHDPRTWRSGLLLSWHGSATSDPVTGYWAVRTRAYLYSELLTGERELYDLTGLAGRPDPYQLENRAGWPAYARTQAKLASMLADLRR